MANLDTMILASDIEITLRLPDGAELVYNATYRQCHQSNYLINTSYLVNINDNLVLYRHASMSHAFV